MITDSVPEKNIIRLFYIFPGILHHDDIAITPRDGIPIHFALRFPVIRIITYLNTELV